MNWTWVLLCLLVVYMPYTLLWFSIGKGNNFDPFDHLFIFGIPAIVLCVPAAIAYINLERALWHTGSGELEACTGPECQIGGYSLLMFAVFFILIYWQSYIGGTALRYVYDEGI